MRAIRRRDNKEIQLSDFIYDKDSHAYCWEDLILEPGKGENVYVGMTDKEEEELRRRYAGLALCGFTSGVKHWNGPEDIAKICVSYADALIQELKK